jgi:hypothetical protein
MNTHPRIGSRVTCAETGLPFVVAREGCSFNYATNAKGEILSLDGAYERDKRELLDRSRPYTCYLSSDGRHVTNWIGRILGDVMQETLSKNGFNGSHIVSVRVRDIHGAWWHGRGSGRSMILNLRPMKEPQ